MVNSNGKYQAWSRRKHLKATLFLEGWNAYLPEKTESLNWNNAN